MLLDFDAKELIILLEVYLEKKEIPECLLDLRRQLIDFPDYLVALLHPFVIVSSCFVVSFRVD